MNFLWILNGLNFLQSSMCTWQNSRFSDLNNVMLISEFGVAAGGKIHILRGRSNPGLKGHLTNSNIKHLIDCETSYVNSEWIILCGKYIFQKFEQNHLRFIFKKKYNTNNPCENSNLSLEAWICNWNIPAQTKQSCNIIFEVKQESRVAQTKQSSSLLCFSSSFYKTNTSPHCWIKI